MNKSIFVSLFLVGFLSSCSSSEGVCEDITIASEQIQACQILHKRIINAKGDVLIRTELERRYQQDCIDIRYYRDDKQAAICGNKGKAKEFRESIEIEDQQ
ncbi:MAG: hypothetical protein V5789_10150 [Colwellia sp.]